jgi:hypothetical protein
LNPLTVKQKIVAMVDGQAGKGSKPRQVDQKKWDDGWEKTFGKKKSKLKPKKKKADKK